MSAYESNIPTPEEAQDHAHAAIEFAVATDTIPNVENLHKNPNDVIVTASTGSGNGIFNREIKIEYADYSLEDDATQPSSERKTDAFVRAGSAEYQAELHTGRFRRYAEGRTAASVERDGYGIHEFSDSNKVKASALITSLAAKRMINEALEVADERVARINAAKETYAKRLSIKDKTPNAEPIEVRKA